VDTCSQLPGAEEDLTIGIITGFAHNADSMPRSIDHQHLLAAARLALRGHGRAEPNPLVGCVIVSPKGQTVGWGHHEKYGEAHAEINALRRAGRNAQGATLYCTLEPCNHQGKTPPCTQAIIDARIARVVIARRDPFPPAAGGIERMRAARIQVDLIDDCQAAVAVSGPFIHRLETGLPWVTVKWAQTLDGKIADRHGKSKWISNEASRRMVHRERGRVDVIMTAIGTVLKDDPLLTARNVRVRRIARRVVIDPELQVPMDSKLVTTTDIAPSMVVCDQRIVESSDGKVKSLRDRGVEVIGVSLEGTELPLKPVLQDLSRRFEAQHVLVEAGTGLMSRLFQQRLVNEAWVFVAPKFMADELALPAVRLLDDVGIHHGKQLQLVSLRRRSADVIVQYRMT
jgi:diaminohydroxyphosphoribosylaminopyrimidine deaminase/5-amino-6-(5-phosphoribosylamino)uracil reductase